MSTKERCPSTEGQLTSYGTDSEEYPLWADEEMDEWLEETMPPTPTPDVSRSNTASSLLPTNGPETVREVEERFLNLVAEARERLAKLNRMDQQGQVHVKKKRETARRAQEQFEATRARLEVIAEKAEKIKEGIQRLVETVQRLTKDGRVVLGDDVEVGERVQPLALSA
ncbi:hypothetical protein BJX99DRAFT_254115 [Aspergillus californicus]